MVSIPEPKRNRAYRFRRVVLHGVRVLAIVLAGLTLVGPYTYDDKAHSALNAATRRWSHWGNQFLGLDITVARQNIFSLARDLDRKVVIVDHATNRSSSTMGLVNWVSRGSLYTVLDALTWFDIPLTARQAKLVNLCARLDDLYEQQDIVIQPDPWQLGVASWYGPGFHGRLAASGEIYNMYDRTAAHKTLPLHSLVRVVSQKSGQSVVVRINDRGPYVGGRIIDLSQRAKQLLGAADLSAVYLERLDSTVSSIDCP